MVGLRHGVFSKRMRFFLLFYVALCVAIRLKINILPLGLKSQLFRLMVGLRHGVFSKRMRFFLLFYVALCVAIRLKINILPLGLKSQLFRLILQNELEQE